MDNEIVRSTINIDLVTKQVLSQIMLDSMEIESEVKMSSLPDDLATKSLEYYSQELFYGECLEQLLSSGEFMDIITSQQMCHMDKGRIAYLNINSEPIKKRVLSKMS